MEFSAPSRSNADNMQPPDSGNDDLGKQRQEGNADQTNINELLGEELVFPFNP